MSEQIFISVIIPVYNVESYLEQCIDSVLNQTYPHFELILVNDGSKDNSGKICDCYAAKDARIKVIHKDNSGVSDSRNQALSLAKGDYICFVDSDDWVNDTYLSDMVNASDKETDLVVSGFIVERTDNQDVFTYPTRSFPCSDAPSLYALIQSRLMYGPCCKLFRTDIIRKYHIAFPTGIHFGEDRLFNADFLKHTKHIRTIASAHYHYRTVADNTLSSSFYPNKYELEYQCWLAFYLLFDEMGALECDIKSSMLKELFWIVADNFLSTLQLQYRKDITSRRKYINQLLATPQIDEIKRDSCYKELPRFLRYCVCNKQVWLVLIYIYITKRI